MLSLDGILHGFAILSAIAATLRAGSRAVYIAEHHVIGIMDGPLILPPSAASTTTVVSPPSSSSSNTIGVTTTTSIQSSHTALYELSECFQHCVRLSILPTLYENVEHHVLNGNGPESTKKDDDSSTRTVPTSLRERHRLQMMGTSLSYSLGGDPPTPKTFRSRREQRPTPQIDKEEAIDDDDVDGEDEECLEQMLEEELHLFNMKKKDKTKAQKHGSNSDPASGLNEEPLAASGSRPWWRFLSKQVQFGNAVRDFSGGDRADEDGSSRDRWDYGYVTEADHFYNVSRTVTTTKSHSSVDPTASLDEDETAHSTPTTTSTTTTIARQRLAELTVYCPETFAHLRSTVFGIPEEEYLTSLLASGPFVSFQSNSKGAARVGGVFFFTRDGAYMIKTIKPEEAKTLLKILPKYHNHMKRYGRSSLLTRFCGMYGVSIEEEDVVEVVGDGSDDATIQSSSMAKDSTKSLAPTGKLQTFVVMNAVFPAEAGKFISERFDLKGSTVGREVSQEELERKGNNAVLKDMDLAKEVELVRSMGMREFGLTIGATAKAALLSQLREDVKFLVDCRVMDYSLLVGIVHMDIHKKQESLRRAMDSINKQDRLLQQLEHKPKRKLDSKAIYILTTPARLLLSPSLYIARKTWNLMRLTLDSIITTPMPYYGSGSCGIDGGKLSVFHGKRRGDRAVYYMGLIDFLQPWTVRKVLERQLKALLGYDTKAISSVTPEEYASRFLDYLDANMT
jgi:hypothetical protein